MAVSAKRNAKIEITADDKTAPGVRSAKRELDMMRRDQARADKAADRAHDKADKDAARTRERASSRIGGAVKSFGAGMLAAAGFDVAGGLGGMVADVFAANKELVRFRIDAQLTEQQTLAFNDSLMKVSTASGVARKDLIEAAHAYQILTGDAKGAIESSELFAQVANASGASMQDIAAVAASLKQNLGLDPSQFRAGFDVLLSMGHKGSVELRDFAGELSGLAPQFSKFGGGGGVKGLTEMAAAMQVIRHGFGSASEAATGLQSLMGGIVQKSAKLEAAGVKVFNIDPKTKKRVLRDFFEIVADMKKRGLDMKDLFHDLGRKEGVRAALELITDEGLAKMHELYDTASNSDQVAKDNATYMNSSAGKLARAWETIKNAVATALTPERIEAFSNAMMKGATFIMDAVGALEHFLGHDTPQDKANTVTNSRLEDAGVGIGDSPIRAQAEAHQIAMAQDTLARGMPGTDAGKAAELSSIQFLKAQGRSAGDISAIPGVGIGADWSFKTGAYNPQTAGFAAAGVTPADFDRLATMVATKLAEAVKGNLNVTVKADANAIATTGAQAPINRSTRTR